MASAHLKPNAPIITLITECFTHSLSLIPRPPLQHCKRVWEWDYVTSCPPPPRVCELYWTYEGNAKSKSSLYFLVLGISSILGKRMEKRREEEREEEGEKEGEKKRRGGGRKRRQKRERGSEGIERKNGEWGERGRGEGRTQIQFSAATFNSCIHPIVP